MNLTRKRFSVLFFSTILLSVLVTAIVVQAATPTTTFTISSGIYPGAPTYTVYGISGTYYAKDQNGLVEFEGTNLVTVLNDIEDALPGTYTGTVHFEAGVFEFASNWAISDTDNLIIKGAGSRATEFRSTADINYFITIGGGCDEITIRDIGFYNPNYASYVVTAVLASIDEAIVWHLKIQDCTFIRCNALWTTQTTPPNCLNHAVLEKLIFDTPPSYAFKLYTVIDVSLDDIWLTEQTYTEGTHALFINSSLSSGVTVNNFRAFYFEYGIQLYDSPDTRVTNSIVDFASFAYLIDNSSRCTFVNSYAHAPNGAGQGFYIGNPSNNTVLTNCQAITCTTGYNDDSNPDGVQSFIGCNAIGSTTTYSIDVNDITRGCLDIADQ